MKKLILTLSVVIGFSAQANEAREQVFMSMGQAPFHGSVQGDLKLSNSGTTDLTNITWDLNGYNFSAKDNCPKALAPQKSCRIRVTYWNNFPGMASARMIIKTSDKIYEVNISASGADDPFRNIPHPPRDPRRP